MPLNCPVFSRTAAATSSNLRLWPVGSISDQICVCYRCRHRWPSFQTANFCPSATRNFAHLRQLGRLREMTVISHTTRYMLMSVLIQVGLAWSPADQIRAIFAVALTDVLLSCFTIKSFILPFVKHWRGQQVLVVFFVSSIAASCHPAVGTTVIVWSVSR